MRRVRRGGVRFAQHALRAHVVVRAAPVPASPNIELFRHAAAAALVTQSRSYEQKGIVV